MIFYKKSSSHELFPEPDRAYILYLGLVPLKHKFHLLINIRSIGEAGSISGGLVSFKEFVGSSGGSLT